MTKKQGEPTKKDENGTKRVRLTLLNKRVTIPNQRKDKQSLREKNKFLIQMHVPSKGKQLLYIELPSLMYLTEKKPNFEETKGFAKQLRVKLGNAKIKSITQKGFERILEIIVEKEEQLRLIIELFSKGNMILADKDNKILAVQQVQRWKARTLKPKEEYKYPEPTTNILKLTEKGFEQLRKTTNKESIVKFLATELSLGGFYAEEACSIAGIEKNQKPIDTKGAYQAIKKLLGRKIKPSLYEKEVLPFESKKLENAKSYMTFNEAIHAKFSKTIDTKEKKQLTEYQQKLDSLKRIIKEQENAVIKLKKEIDDNTAKAELIYHKYSEVMSFLKQLKELQTKGELIKVKKHKAVKEVNQKEKYLIVEI